jgi:hypothetical protein
MNVYHTYVITKIKHLPEKTATREKNNTNPHETSGKKSSGGHECKPPILSTARGKCVARDIIGNFPVLTTPGSNIPEVHMYVCWLMIYNV